MDVTFTDFLIGFSSALDLLSPENGHRGVRRAYIVMNIARQRQFSLLAQQRLFIAALLRDISRGHMLRTIAPANLRISRYWPTARV